MVLSDRRRICGGERSKVYEAAVGKPTLLNSGTTLSAALELVQATVSFLLNRLSEHTADIKG